MPAAVVLTVLLALLAVFQLALALGAPLGHLAWGGQHRTLPPGLRIGSAVSIGVYALIGSIVLDRVGLLDLYPRTVAVAGTWVVVGYFVVGVAMNAVSRSRPERFTMVPVCLALATLSLLVALGPAGNG